MVKSVAHWMESQRCEFESHSRQNISHFNQTHDNNHFESYSRRRVRLGKVLFRYAYMRLYVHIYEKLGCRYLISALQHRFLDWHLMRFGKELFKYYSRIFKNKESNNGIVNYN